MLKKISVVFLLLSMFCWNVPAFAQNTDRLLRFTVIAVTDDEEARREFETTLVSKLKASHYDVVPSHLLVSDIAEFQNKEVYQKLQNMGMQGALLLMPVDVGEHATIKSAKRRVWSTTYDSIEAFVESYRGGDFDTQALVQATGFLITGDDEYNFWQGMIWLDDKVDSKEEGIEKLSGLVLSNLNASRGYLRQLLGFEPLSTRANF